MEYIKKIKLNKKTVVYFVVLGIVLMVIGGWGNDDKNDKIQTSEENRLEQVLSHIEGVGEVKVMLSSEEETGGFTSKADVNTYKGAVILAEGGSKSEVKEKIIKAVQAVTGLDYHKIVVYKLDK